MKGVRAYRALGEPHFSFSAAALADIRAAGLSNIVIHCSELYTGCLKRLLSIAELTRKLTEAEQLFPNFAVSETIDSQLGLI